MLRQEDDPTPSPPINPLSTPGSNRCSPAFFLAAMWSDGEESASTSLLLPISSEISAPTSRRKRHRWHCRSLPQPHPSLSLEQSATMSNLDCTSPTPSRQNLERYCVFPAPPEPAFALSDSVSPVSVYPESAKPEKINLSHKDTNTILLSELPTQETV